MSSAIRIGLAIGCINPILSAVQYERLPSALQSRVLGAMGAGVLAGAPLGPMLAGLGVGAIGLRGTMLLVGGLYLLATLSPFLPV